MFVTNQGSFTSNPINSFVGHLVLGANTGDLLVLSEFAAEPYARGLENLDRSNGRSLAGSMRINGNDYSPTLIWLLNFIVVTPQLSLFESLLASQIATPLTLGDRWQASVGGAVVNKSVWVDVDGRYVTPFGIDWLLQFTAREII